jgi:sodium transport system permease protein
MTPIYTVFKKEFLDIVRDVRALLTVSILSILAGPLLLLIISNVIANYEAKAERRVVVIDGMDHAPSLTNYLLQESVELVRAPLNYQEALKSNQLQDPVIVIPNDFETNWLQGKPFTITLMTNSSNARANAGVGRVKRWLSSFVGERTTLQLTFKGIAPSAHDYILIEEVDLANPNAEGAAIFGMIPYFLLLASLYSVWGSAIETTIMEKEKKTLEPLIMTPHSLVKIMLGKWTAVFSVGAIITSVAISSFVFTQYLMNSDTLKSMFSFGWIEAFKCLLITLPLTGLFAAVLIAIGAQAKSVRQAQTNATFVLLLTALLPMLSHLNGSEIQLWQRLLPIYSQHFYVMSIFKGDNHPMLAYLLPAIICAIGINLCLRFASTHIQKRN